MADNLVVQVIYALFSTGVGKTTGKVSRWVQSTYYLLFIYEEADDDSDKSFHV